MKFGTLQVALLTGETREFPIDLPSVIVGRGEGVTILLDDFSISRRHARLTVDSGRLMVEDLASAAGTFINGERLSPNIRYLVDDGAELRFGDLEAGYSPPPPAEAATASREDDGAEISPTRLHVALVSPAVAIDPGRQATATITVNNRGRVVDTVSVEVTDLPPEWYTIETSKASLLPGAQLNVQVTLHPPRRHDSLAGHYDFTVRVNSQEQQRDAIAIGSFEVLPFESFTLSFEAIRSGRNFRLIAENRGNEPVRCALAGQDDEQAFRYQFDAPAVQLQPGQKQVVALKVRRSRQLFGPKIAHPFEVVGTAATGSEVRARGQLSVDPPLQKFRMPALFTLAALILGVTALGILILTDGESVQTATAEDEYAGVHLCDEEDGQAKQEERNRDAASEAPNTSAVVAGLYDGGRPIFGQTDANGAPFFAQSDPRWSSVEYARSTELPNGKDWCGTTISQCGCAMTSVAVMLALYNVVTLPDGQPLTPQSLNAWFNGDARRTDRGWVSRGYIYGDVIWTAANELSGEIARANPGTPTVRFVRTGTGSEDEIRAELRAGHPIILEVPGHWIAAVGLDGDTILINDPFYRDRTTLDAYKGKVRSSVLYETSADLSAVVLTAPADVKFKVTDRQGRVVSTGDTADGGSGEPVNQIPGASFSAHRAWRDPTCIEKAPPTGAGTNQIMLPGSRDDYTIEILGTGDQTGSIAIHTYGRDGTGSIATIEGQEGTRAELDYDPNAPAPVVRVPNGGEATTTPTPDSGGDGGGPGDETPTPAPTPSATPTPTETPFVESRTNITLSAEPGQTRVETADNTGFELGDPIRFAPGLPNEEDNLIVGFGSFILATPLKFAHGPGEPILRLPRPPGQGPGLPPGITPPAQTGPLLPPDTVGMACSTIYQPSPKQATFICDLQVTGDYTNTRWSLNGQTVTDFTGSSSFLMAFNDDTPATVSATVCNVTICRSVTRAERIVFPANLGGTTFTGPGGTGTGTTPVATPPAGGAIAIVCGTEFPITPDGQLAQFSCQASFSGDFTSISWSAPGGTPANQSGLSKTFTTTVRNVEGAPVSLKVTATVCNFGTCRTSDPTTVGIGRTITTLESSPDGQVNSGHRLTLMARVDGIGGVVPQGGTVQFYADGFAIGPSATLFTVGKVAVAQVAVETSGLTSGDPEGSGIDHVFVGKYSGGINAFGSDSLERIITVLPPIKDGCDSVDEDNDGIVDNTCRNVVSQSTGFATAGSFATPKNLGGGTVLQTLSLAGGLEGSTATTLILRPGAPFTVSGSAGRTDYCPGCIRQVYIGIGGNQTSGAPPIGPKCVVSGGLPLHTVSNVSFSTTFNAPDKPGVYYLRATTTLDYFCVGPQVGPPENSVGRIVVEEPVSADLQIWSVPANLWDTLDPNATGPNDPKLLSEIPSSGQVMLRAITNPSVPYGRVGFVTEPESTTANNAMLTLPPPNQSTIVLLQQVCPANGTLGNQPCIPGEARLIVQAGSAARGETFNVTAALENDELELPTGQSGFTDFTIRFPQVPAPTSNTKSLSVLLPSVTGITASPTGNVAICATAPPGCTPVVLTASVSAPPPLTETPTGGSVEFYWKPQSGGSWTLLGTDTTVVAGVASLDVQAGLGTAQLGDVVFQARFKRGSTNFEDSESAASDTVKFVRASATAAIVSVTAATNGKIGDQITLVASVAGSNGFDASGGTVEFKARASNAQIGAAQSLGTASLALDSPSGQWRATLTYTTGVDNTPLADAGAYLFTAHFGETATLAADVSNDFSFTLTPQDPTITVTLPNSGTITVGDTGNIRATLSTSGNASKFTNQSATIQFRNNGTALPNGTVSVSNLGSGVYGADYSVVGLAAGSYNITAHYSGNNTFAAVTSDPAQTLTVNKFTPTVAVNAITSVQVGNNLSLSATISGTGLSCPGIRCPAGGTISFYKGSVAEANLLGTSAAISTTSGSISISTGGTTLLPNAGDYTIVARYNGNATNGNVAAATSATATATLSKRTPTVTTDNVTGALGTSIKLSATVSTGSASVSPACTSCLQFKVGAAESTAVAVGSKVNVLSDGKAELPSVATGTGGTGEPFPSNGPYTIWAVYDANTNLNTANDSATVTIGPPPPT
ncbi:MAG: Ig-like domain repeat protein, partial [Dehalococcoidia bacterium]|nr:Ig-like domain repeat protein [Dehalococcoidia bacterium]